MGKEMKGKISNQGLKREYEWELDVLIPSPFLSPSPDALSKLLEAELDVISDISFSGYKKQGTELDPVHEDHLTLLPSSLGSTSLSISAEKENFNCIKTSTVLATKPVIPSMLSSSQHDRNYLQIDEWFKLGLISTTSQSPVDRPSASFNQLGDVWGFLEEIPDIILDDNESINSFSQEQQLAARAYPTIVVNEDQYRVEKNPKTAKPGSSTFCHVLGTTAQTFVESPRTCSSSDMEAMSRKSFSMSPAKILKANESPNSLQRLGGADPQGFITNYLPNIRGLPDKENHKGDSTSISSQWSTRIQSEDIESSCSDQESIVCNRQTITTSHDLSRSEPAVPRYAAKEKIRTFGDITLNSIEINLPETEQPSIDDGPTYIDSPGDKFIENIFQECNHNFSSSPTTSFVSHGSTNTPQSSHTTRSISLSSPGSANKRAASNKGGEDGDADEPDHDRGGHKRAKLASNERLMAVNQPGQRLACHLHISDRQRYCKNGTTGKKYETCSGPGWPKMHYLREPDRSRQHLGNSAGSVHKKIRCPRCLAPFKTATAVLKHQEAHPSECSQDQAHIDEDDISKESWVQIDRDISRQSFENLPMILREEIDLRVLENLDAYAPTEPVNIRKIELRKWYMPSVYDDDSLMPLSNAEHLIKTFKETVISGAERGDIDGITDENLEILQEYLRAAIHAASRTTQESPHFQSAKPPVEPITAGGLDNQDNPGPEWATDVVITTPAQAAMHQSVQEPPQAMTEVLRETAQIGEWDSFDIHNQTQFEEPANANHTVVENFPNSVDPFSEFGFDIDENEWERIMLGLQ
ncbi:hypothetical protein N431DRAFT_536775 [Stipitochalara longipes BDJ]|nr:hypothetical protein N431DRAFT_536775 [Stipitochalara longipes BDJ]